MDQKLKNFNHQIRNLISLTKSEINTLKENVSHEQLIILIQSYNEALLMCNEIINDSYKNIIKK